MKWLTTTFVVIALPLWAETSSAQDEGLIGQLASADDYQTQHAAIDAIDERLESGPLSAPDTEAILRILVYDQQMADPFLARLLPRLAGDAGFRDNELNLIAAGLTSDIVYQYSAASEISEALKPAVPRLPDEAFASLVAGVSHVAVLNAGAAMDVLAETPPDDVRNAIAVDVIRRALEQKTVPYARSRAVAALGRLGEQAPLPAPVVETLVLAATNDDDAIVRLDALEVLVRQPVDGETRTLLSRSVAESILNPGTVNSPLGGSRTATDALARTRNVLAALHELPYPEHVPDALIRLLWYGDTSGTLALLSPVVERGELTAAQRESFEQAARRTRRFEEREAIYATLYPTLTEAQLASVLIRFAAADDAADRVKAGYQLIAHYRESAVPGDVAETVSTLLFADIDSESRHIAARLLLAADDAGRERQVIDALRRYADDYEFNVPVVERLAAADVEQLVVEFASDEALPPQFRAFVLRLLQQTAAPEAGLSPSLETRVAEIARTADDYYLIQQAGDTLEAWGAEKPIRVALTDRANQSRALFIAWCVLTVTALAAGLLGLVSLSRMRLRSTRKVWRVSLVVGWSLLTGVLLVLLAGGLIGFLGHNSAPLPIDTLKLNLPGFAASIVLTVAALLLRRRSVRQASLVFHGTP